MTEKHIKWNTENMVSYLVNFDDDVNNLNEQKKVLEELNKTIAEAWQGINGMSYDLMLDISIDNLGTIITELSALNQDLGRVIDDCYKPCEEEIRTLVNSLSGKVG